MTDAERTDSDGEEQEGLFSKFSTDAAFDILEKSRRGLLILSLTIVGLTVVSFVFAEQVLFLLVKPLGKPLVAYSPYEPFQTLLSLALTCGLTGSVPVAAHLIWSGIVSRWRPEWKAFGAVVVVVATLLFLAGGLLSYFVLLPAGIGFLVSFESENIGAYLSAAKFVSFVTTMILALGLCFEMPLLAFFLARAGWLKPRVFGRWWRHAILACTVVAAIITPTPDIYNLMLMALPLLGLYFVSFIVTIVAVPRGGPPTPTDG